MVHFLNLLVPWDNILHYDLLSLLWNIWFPLFSLSQVFLSLFFLLISFHLQPIVLEFNVAHFTLVDLICHMNCFDCFLQVLFRFFWFVLHLHDSILNSQALLLFVFLNKSCLEFIGWACSLNTINDRHSQTWHLLIQILISPLLSRCTTLHAYQSQRFSHDRHRISFSWWICLLVDCSLLSVVWGCNSAELLACVKGAVHSA